MTATGHALIGATIAATVPIPLIGLPVAFLSHFACDKIPHWDPMTNRAHKTMNLIFIETVLDVLLGYFLVALIFLFLSRTPDPVYIFLGAFAAQLPDWMEVPYSMFRLKIPLVYNNYKIQSRVHDLWFDSRMNAPWGIVTQIVVVGIILLFLFLPR